MCQPAAEDESCRYEQKVVASNGDEITLTFLAGAPDIALFHAPLHVLLPPGLTLAFDGRVSGRVEFRACSPRGCLASVALEGAVRSRMARSNRVAIRFATQSAGSAVADFSLSGSAAILSAM